MVLGTVRKILADVGLRGKPPPFSASIGQYAMTKEEEDAFLASPRSDLEATFSRHCGRTVHKWIHYLPVYERVFSPYRTKPHLTLLEIGISLGGSLEIWRDYFGPDASIAGLDIDERCRNRVDPPNRVFIGSQADPSFLRTVIAEIGIPDIVIDDGSHVANHQRTSFETLFPLLDRNGVYIIEDSHTSYWEPLFEGGYRIPGSILEYCKAMIEDIHGNYHDRTYRQDLRDTVESIAFHDSMIVINKGEVRPPRHVHLPPGSQPAVDPII